MLGTKKPFLACAVMDQFAARTNKLMAVKSTAPTANVTCLEAIFALLRLDNAVQTHCKYETRLQANKHRRRNAGSSSSPCAGRMTDGGFFIARSRAALRGRS
jgi:hypothetical protein